MQEQTEVPPLSQREQEHLTYLNVYELYNESERKREHYRRYGTIFMLVSGLVFLALMFSLESKIEFLCLWIITVIYCVTLMIRADYQYDLYRKMLGISKEGEKEIEEYSQDISE